MQMSHVLVAVAFVLVGVVFAGMIRSLPLVNMLPQY